jgi:2-iminobutanoate/2-iminopropanoate deaminase
MKVIETPNAPKPLGPYSQGIVANGFVFVCGSVGVDPKTGQVVSGGLVEQTKRAIENMKAILEASGSSLEKVVKTTVYLKDASAGKEMNQVYSSYFTSNRPVRSTVVVGFTGPDFLIEIDAIAVQG